MRCTMSLLLALALAGCSSTAKKPYKPVREDLGPEQFQQLKTVEHLWKTEDPKFPAARDQVLKDPVSAAWWTRTLIGYAVGSYKQNLRHQRDLLGTVKSTEPVGYQKAREELRIAGGVAVPIVVDEMLRHRDATTRALGVEVLIYMGPGVVPNLAPFLLHEDKRVPRQVLQVLGGLATDPAARDLLLQHARHADWTIRAQALESLAMVGESQLPVLREAALRDPDAFVRRRVVMALGRFKDRETATVVVAYYKEVLRQGDRQGIRAAQQTLQTMSGVRGDRTEAFWERWVESLAEKSSKS